MTDLAAGEAGGGEAQATPAATSSRVGTISGLIKEFAAALIAMTLLVAFLVALVSATTKVGTDHLAGAKDLLNVVSGFVGVVLGYYFGRIPAERQAETARAEAETANARATEARESEQAARRTARSAVRKAIAVASGQAPAAPESARAQAFAAQPDVRAELERMLADLD